MAHCTRAMHTRDSEVEKLEEMKVIFDVYGLMINSVFAG